MSYMRLWLGLSVLLGAGCAQGVAGPEETGRPTASPNNGGDPTGGSTLDADAAASGGANTGADAGGGAGGAASGGGGASAGNASGVSDAGATLDAGAVTGSCGNGTRDQNEACDGADLNGMSCTALGYSGGTAACTSKCVLDTTGCTRPTLSTTIETSEFDSSLDSPDTKSAAIQIMAPSDLTNLVLGIDPLDGLSTIQGTLTGSSGTLGTCAATAMGAACDFSNLTLGASAGGMLTLSLTNTSGSYLDQLRIRIGGETGGVTAPVAFSGTWGDTFGDTNYVLWPVGSATSSLSYAWTDTSFDSFSTVFRSPSGTKVQSIDVFGPSTSSYPKDVSKTGWYLFGTAPYHPDSEGQSYTFTVTAN